MKIRGNLFDEWLNAINDAFDLDSLETAWRRMEGVDTDLRDFASTDSGFEDTIDDVLRYVDSHDLEHAFITTLRKANPTNKKLAEVATRVEAELAKPDDVGAAALSADYLHNRYVQIGAVIAAILLIALLVAIFRPSTDPIVVNPPANSTEENGGSSSAPNATETNPTPDVGPETLVIGQALDGSTLNAIRLGNGDNAALFVGGFHAGYAPSSQTIANRAVDYFEQNPGKIPDSVRVYIIPNLNPTSPYAPGVWTSRLNANGVDLNRNWDCDWTADAKFGRRDVSGGTAPFSEPEAQALKSLIEEVEPQAVVIWGARATKGLVAPGGCEDQSQVSVPLGQAFGIAAGYPIDDFDPESTITGDVTNWLDKSGIPAIYVLTPDYVDPDWANNLRGIQAVIDSVQ